jgi:hypothetical protein
MKSMKPKTEEEIARETVPDGYALDEGTGERKIPTGSMWLSKIQQKWCEPKSPHPTYRASHYAIKVKTEEEIARESVPEGFVFDEQTLWKRLIPAGSMRWSKFYQKWIETKVPQTTYSNPQFALKVTPPVKTQEEIARESVPDGYAFNERTGERKIPAGSMWWSEFHQEWCEIGFPHTTDGSNRFALKVTLPVKTQEKRARACVPEGFVFDERTGERDISVGSMKWNEINQKWYEIRNPHITYGIGYFALNPKTQEELARETVPDRYAFDERTGKRVISVGSMMWSEIYQEWYKIEFSRATYGSSYFALKVTLPSRRFRCANCDIKCRSSKADRGKRKYCRPCEDGIKFSYEWK